MKFVSLEIEEKIQALKSDKTIVEIGEINENKRNPRKASDKSDMFECDCGFDVR